MTSYSTDRIPVKEIYLNETIMSWGVRRFLDRYTDDEVFESKPIRTVDIDLIIPTQGGVSKDNLQAVSHIGNDTGAYLVECDGWFYVVDGHHRIAKEILRGVKTITAHVYRIDYENIIMA